MNWISCCLWLPLVAQGIVFILKTKDVKAHHFVRLQLSNRITFFSFLSAILFTNQMNYERHKFFIGSARHYYVITFSVNSLWQLYFSLSSFIFFCACFFFWHVQFIESYYEWCADDWPDIAWKIYIDWAYFILIISNESTISSVIYMNIEYESSLYT